MLTTAPYAVPSSNAACSSGRPPDHTSGQNTLGASIRNSTAAHVTSWPLRNQDRRTGLNLKAVAADQELEDGRTLGAVAADKNGGRTDAWSGGGRQIIKLTICAFRIHDLCN